MIAAFATCFYVPHFARAENYRIVSIDNNNGAKTQNAEMSKRDGIEFLKNKLGNEAPVIEFAEPEELVIGNKKFARRNAAPPSEGFIVIDAESGKQIVGAITAKISGDPEILKIIGPVRTRTIEIAWSLVP